jgi:hypothetical protein
MTEPDKTLYDRAEAWLGELVTEFERLTYAELAKLEQQQATDRDALVRFRDFPEGRLCADPIVSTIGRLRRRITVEIVVVSNQARWQHVPCHWFQRWPD